MSSFFVFGIPKPQTQNLLALRGSGRVNIGTVIGGYMRMFIGLIICIHYPTLP